MLSFIPGYLDLLFPYVVRPYWRNRDGQAQFSKAAISSVQLLLSASSADSPPFDSRLHRKS